MSVVEKLNQMTQDKEKQEASNRLKQKLGSYSYNPYLKSDGSLINPYLNYQKILDGDKASSVAKNWITEATGLTQKSNNPVNTISANSGNTYSGVWGNSKGSAKGQALVDTAKKYLGTKYVWGGTTPNGFDCSGLVQYVCRENGIDVSRTTYDQIKDGVSVSRENLQPGDFILFGTADNPHHIGMYAGNGQYIHAPKTGDVVKISNLSDRGDYLTARRVV